MKRILMLLALVLLVTPTLVSVDGCSKQDSVMAPVLSQPVVVDTTSSIKPGDNASPLNAVDRRTKPWPGPDWSARCLWEARYALSRRADGTSAWPLYDSRGVLTGYYGDYNYVATDWYAYGRAYDEAGGPPWIGEVSDQGSYHRGGWCTFFGRLVYYRASYWAGYGWHLTVPNYGQGSMYGWCDTGHMTQDFRNNARPGWMIFRKDYHVAILDSRGSLRGVDGWWVIDSNYTGGNGNFRISKHFFSMSELASYWAWAPSLATSN